MRQKCGQRRSIRYFVNFQYGTHLYPLLYSFLLLAIIYHAFVTLFLDYSGSYEEKCRRLLPLIIGAIVVVAAVMAAPSGIYSGVGNAADDEEDAEGIVGATGRKIPRCVLC